MRNIMQGLRLVLLLLFPVLLLGMSLSGGAGASDIVIIANPGVTADSLSREAISDIYQGHKGKWENGRTIRVVMLKKGATHERFSEEVVGLSTANLKKLWKKVIFSGSGTPPKILRSEDKCVEYIAATDGAIGYISTATNHEGVKVIEIQ